MVRNGTFSFSSWAFVPNATHETTSSYVFSFLLPLCLVLSVAVFFVFGFLVAGGFVSVGCD